MKIVVPPTSEAAAATQRLIPGPRPVPGHGGFDLATLPARGSSVAMTVSSRPGAQFYISKGLSYDDAVAGAMRVATKSHQAYAIVAAHPGQLFVIPAFTRPAGSAAGSDLSKLVSLDGIGTPTRLSDRVLALVDATHAIDLRGMAPSHVSAVG